MSRASDRLREFHEAFEVEPNVDQRIHLHAEEAQELAEVLAALAAFDRGTSIVSTRRALLPAIARELADVMVIAYGTADLFGIDLDAAFDAVMDANMAKLPRCGRCSGAGEVNFDDRCPDCNGSGAGKPIKRLDGKVMKPEGWQEPDMSGAVLLPTELDRRDLRLGRFEGVVVGREGAKIHVLLKPDPRLRSTPTLAADPLPEGMVIPRRGEDCMVEVGPGFEWARMVP